MNRGDNYLITYHAMNNKTVLAMFLKRRKRSIFL